MAGSPRHGGFPGRAYAGVAWFPAGEYERALQTWPSFAEDYEHGAYAAYCARLERLLRDLRAQGVGRLALTPMAIDSYLGWCAEHSRDSEESDSRAAYVTELVERNAVHPWPPERNEPCWCGSERKYKKCCLRARGSATPQATVPGLPSGAPSQRP